MCVRAASIGLRCETDEFVTLVIPFHFAFVKANLGWLVGDGLYLVARFVCCSHLEFGSHSSWLVQLHCNLDRIGLGRNFVFPSIAPPSWKCKTLFVSG